jgi:hypothetical protein
MKVLSLVVQSSISLITYLIPDPHQQEDLRTCVAKYIPSRHFFLLFYHTINNADGCDILQ